MGGCGADAFGRDRRQLARSILVLAQSSSNCAAQCNWLRMETCCFATHSLVTFQLARVIALSHCNRLPYLISTFHCQVRLISPPSPLASLPIASKFAICSFAPIALSSFTVLNSATGLSARWLPSVSRRVTLPCHIGCIYSHCTLFAIALHNWQPSFVTSLLTNYHCKIQ